MSGPHTLVVDFRLRPAPGAAFTAHVKLEAPPGFTTLFGPSGAGKSTALAGIVGLVRPEAGRVALGDDVWFDHSAGIDRPVHRRRVAFVFQSPALFPHMTALGNVAYGIDRALPRGEQKEHALRLLDRMKVGHVAHRRPRSFSGGEAQRVALARALAMAPRLVLLDEAFSAMDRDLRRDLLKEVRAYVEEAQVPAIQVTHVEADARALGDRVVLIEGGRTGACGSADLLLAQSHKPA